MPIGARSIQVRNLIALMASLQVLWLITRWFLGDIPTSRQLPAYIVYTVFFGVVIGHMPTGFVSRIRRLREGLVRNEKLLILTLSAIVLSVGFLYISYHHIGYDDSCFAASRIVAVEGLRSLFADYVPLPWLGRQHPPLAPVVYGFAMRVLGVNLLVTRLTCLMFGIGTILATYFLGRELLDRTTGLLAAFLLLSTRDFLRFATGVALIDMPMAFFFALSMLLTLRMFRKPTYWLSVAVGISIGAGLLSKYTMLLIYPALLCYFIVNRQFRRFIPHLGLVVLVSVCIVAPWLLYAYRNEIFDTHTGSVISYSRTLISSTFIKKTYFGIKLMFETLLARLPSSLGIYSLPLLVLGGLHLLRRRGPSDLFLLIWIAPAFLLLTLTLPVPRYFFPIFPALTIVMACWLRHHSKVVEQVILLALLYCGETLYLYTDIKGGIRLLVDFG